jgi:hypothetical protein
MSLLDNWDDEEVVLVEEKKKSKLSEKYPEIEQHLPKLFKILKKEKPDRRKILLEEHLEAVSFWRPKRALATENRHETNKKKDEEDFKVLVEYWKLMLGNIGLAENSIIQDRERVKHILEKYVSCEARSFKYVGTINNAFR